VSAELAAARLRHWREDPVAFVREQFQIEPDLWQADVLRAFPTSMRLAMKACKGPGKTAVLAWLAWNFLLTRPHPKVIATSITSDNLADGLWSEMAKWQNKSPLLKSEFTWHKESITYNQFPETWFMVARTWPRTANPAQQADTLAGKHADYMLFLLDEAGGIPDAVMAAADAGLANARVGSGKEAHIVIAGNPTHLEGPLYKACTSAASLWHVTEITSDPDDPKRSPRVSVEWAREQIATYGRDNPWVLVNVFGRFPPSSLNSLLGPDEVRDAMARKLQPTDYESQAKVLGVDVAREGDDRSVIFPRWGLRALEPIVLRNSDSIQGAGAVASKWRDWQADGCFIDNTGGFGGGWLDQIRTLGYSPVGVHFAGQPTDMRYFNKRAEMHFLLAQWVKEGGALPSDPLLAEELTAPTYAFKGDRFMIEPKDTIKAKIQRSPDLADALALTFAHPVFKPHPMDGLRRQRKERVYDMFAE
jgi:hypothetical protein